MIGIKVNLSKYTGRMNENRENIPRVMRDIVRALGFRVERYSKLELYPGHGKVTGRLRSSIRPEFEGRNRVTISPHTNYASLIERRYAFMKIGAKRTDDESDMVIGQVVKQYFG